MKKAAQFERWMWIELLGFDREERDFGVEALCGRAGFVPHSITLLLSDPQFVHGHIGQLSQFLGEGVCSYGGHPYNEERERQNWTARDLRRLIQKLQDKNIEVYFCHFDAPIGGWLSEHPELRVVTRHAETMEFISPYKRLKDGRLYRDEYIEKVCQVVQYYGFDGLHAGDGFAHPRLPIYEGDFSNDTVSQYLERSGDTLPSSLSSLRDQRKKLVKARAAWIWRERRQEWITFQSERSTEFWAHVAKTLRGLGKKLAYNTCWTRDPFEALYRYGVDYEALHRAGVHAFLAETAAAVQEYGGDLSYGERGNAPWEPGGTIRKFTSNLQMLRAAMPKAKIIFMNGIKDTNEAWNGIRHAPTNLESEILSHTSIFSVDGSKKLRPAADGVVSVLSDGLSSAEWKWIRERWDLGYSLRPDSILGAAVYLPEHFAQQFTADYIKNRSIPPSQILARLSLAGAPLSITVNSGQLAHWKGPVLVIHPQLLSKEEWHRLLERKEWPLFTVGGEAPKETCRTFHYQYGIGGNRFCVSVFNGNRLALKIAGIPKPKAFDTSKVEDPFQWLVALPAAPIPSELFEKIAAVIVEVSNGVRVLDGNHDVRAWAYALSGKRIRIYARNESFFYRHCAIETPCIYKRIETLTAFPGNPVVPDGKVLRFKMAGKSLAIFELSHPVQS